MNIKDTGGPAFPVECDWFGTGDDTELRGIQTGNHSGWHPGMTLRDWFAGQALAGILAHQFSKMVANVPEPLRYEMAATDAYVLADAMLKERSK